MSSALEPNPSGRKVAGWDEALRELVSADLDYVKSMSDDVATEALSRMKDALVKIHGILATVVQSLVVPEDVGRNILSLTEGWENFWVDYDLLSAVQGPSTLSISSLVPLDALGTDTIDVMAEDFSLDAVPENLKVIVCARRRLLKAISNDQARLVLICARLTAVDILLRQPRKSSVFLSSYFQSFPSFICQVASVSNLMAARALSDSTPILSNSIESMIAFGGMSMLSTVITETNHITQALSVLSANNPHAGILANLIGLTLSSSSLGKGQETFQLAKAAIYVLMSSIQNARHPSTVANPTMLRRVLDVLMDPISHPEVTHACCVCLEVALEYSHNSFTVLFRDLDALDKLITRGNFLVDVIRSDERAPIYTLPSTQKALNSVFGLLRFSFQTQEIHVGINLHEKLSASNSPLLRLLKEVLSTPMSVIGKSPLNGCLTLIGNVMADDPLIISTLVDVGLVEALCTLGSTFSEKQSGEVLTSLFVATGAVLLHESGVTKARALGEPIRRLLRGIIGNEFESSQDTKETDDPNRIPSDIGMLAGQTCDDIIRNRADMKKMLCEVTVAGLDDVMIKDSEIPLDKRMIPGLRVLFGGLLSTTEQVETFIKANGVAKLCELIVHPSLRNGALLDQVPGTTRNHPIMVVFKQVAQRCGRHNSQAWQLPLAELVLSSNLSESPMNESVFSLYATICLILTSAAPAGLTSTLENPNGPYLYIAHVLMSRLADAFAFSQQPDSAAWISSAWSQVKNYLSVVGRLSNSLFHPLGAQLLDTRTSISAGVAALGRIAVQGVMGFANSIRPTESGDITELVDVLNRIFIEDRNHAIRPITVVELYRMGGFEKLVSVFEQFVSSQADVSGLSGFESFLIFFERVTSFKRITNSPITMATMESNLVGEWTPKNLNLSVTNLVGNCCFDLISKFLEMSSLSSTAATAIAKILSHTVMLLDVKRGVEEVSGTSKKRSRSPAKKRARKSSKKSSSANIPDLINQVELTDELFSQHFATLTEPVGFVDISEAAEIGQRVSAKFLELCLALGDAGGCESSLAELIQRHVEYPAVSMEPSHKKDSEYLYVISVCFDACFGEKRNRTAAAVFDALLEPKRIGEIVDALTKLEMESLEGSEDWLSRILSVVSRLIVSALYLESFDLDRQKSLIKFVVGILETVSNSAPSEKFGNLTQACLGILSTLVRRTCHMPLIVGHIDVLLRVPAFVRTSETAPLLTEIFLSLVGSELVTAIKIYEDLERHFNNSVQSIAMSPGLVNHAVRDPDLFKRIVKQTCKRSREGDDDVFIIRDTEACMDYSQFKADVETCEIILNKLVGLVLTSIAQVDKTTCSGLSDMLPPVGDQYKSALTVESLLITMTVILSEISIVRQYDDRYNGIQLKYLNELVSTVGGQLVHHLSTFHDSTGVAAARSLDPNVFKLMRVWFNSVNKSSPWLTEEVLGMIRMELEKPLIEEDQVLLRSYAYGGLVFLLTEAAEVGTETIEQLLPLLSDLLKRGSDISALCRFDSHMHMEALYASMHGLLTKVKSAGEVSTTERTDESSESDDGDDADVEMSEGDDESMDMEMPEEFDLEEDDDEEEDEGADDSEDDDVDIDIEPEMLESVQEGAESGSDDEENVFSDGEGSGSEESSEESEEDYDEEEYGEGWSEYDDYDVEWEEDDEEDEENEDIIEGDNMGFMPTSMEDDIGIEVADYMMEPTGSPQLRPVGSPGGSKVTSVSGVSPGLAMETIRSARELMENLFMKEIAETKTDDGESEEDGEEGPSQESSGPSELLNMTEEDQLAALQGLSPEERASIQQALGMDDEYFDDEEDDSSSFEEMDFGGMLPPNIRISHGAIPEMHMTVEVPRNLSAERQASMLNQAISEFTHDMMLPPGGVEIMNRTSSSPKKSQSRSEFTITDSIARPEQADKLCVRRRVVSEPLIQAMELSSSFASRTLMLRNQVPLKPSVERVLIYLCLESRSRKIVLQNLFSSLIKFVYPAGGPWTLSGDEAMPPLTGVFDGGIHPLLTRESRSMDVNAPGQCRSVGSGRLINMLKFIVEHVPRARLWFTELVVNEARVVLVADTTGFDGRKTPERVKRRTSTSNTPQHGLHYASSDGEGPLVRAVSSHSAIAGAILNNPRKVNPLSVSIKLLSSPLMWGSPSHSLILMSLVHEVLAPFPDSAADRSDCDSTIRQAVPEDAIQLLCEFLVENKSRLRHMPEFDKAVGKATQVLVSLCKDVKVREIVRQRLLSTAGRLVNDLIARLNEKESSFSAVPLVRLFRTAKEAFGTKRVEVGESESFLNFASSISNIEALWSAIDARLSAHNNLLLSAPSVAQQALQKRRRGESFDSTNEEASVGSTTNKIAALETIAKLIPLVELFLSAHDVSAVWKKSEHERTRPGRWSTEAPTEKENQVARKAMDFIERHRRPVNSMVKSRPSILSKAFGPLVAICPHLLDFDNKRSFFRTKLRQLDGDSKHAPPQLKLTVRRDDVFRDSYAKLQIRSKDEWRGRLNVTFQGEEGVDAGGLVREWFSILAREIFNPNYALFTPASGRPSTFLINPASSVNPDHIHYFKFCGRFIGKAVYDNQRIDAYFVRSFYKHMLGQEVTWRDMEATDPDYFKNLNWILENDMTDVDYYSFTVEENEFGKLKVVELVPNGEDIRVTEQNKHEYVRLVCEHKLIKGIQEQLKAFLQGFHEVIPEHIVGSLFDDKELEMLISGLPTIDLEDLRRNTDYVHYTSDSDQIKWFWTALGKFSEDELAWFLQFVTGSTQVPLEGFKGLAGMHGPQRFSIHRIRAEDRLPTAHTCFNQLDLPDYRDYDTLEAKLKQAVREGHSGFGFI